MFAGFAIAIAFDILEVGVANRCAFSVLEKAEK